MSSATGFVPPPYPQDRLGTLRRLADALPGGVVDCSVGDPIDPVPQIVVDALRSAAPAGSTYPATIGSPYYRDACAGWLERRFGVEVTPADVIACIGTKELVASLPHVLHLRVPGRDVVLYPAVSYPTYAMGAQLAGLRAVPVPVDADWHLDLSRVDPADAERALLLWINEPANPTGAAVDARGLAAMVEWARARGIIAVGDECYAEFTYGDDGAPADPVTVLRSDHTGVLAVHSLSKRSNLAGYRAGFVAGDPELVKYLGEVRKHAGLMMPAPIQAAAAVAWSDDEHVEIQRQRYAERRALTLPTLERFGLVHDGGPSTFYLWLRDAEGTDDGWELAARLAEAGTRVAPGDLYGPAGADHVRLALTQPNDRLELALQRLRETADRR
jgi:succinyldiaminopimelate transaminase